MFIRTRKEDSLAGALCALAATTATACLGGQAMGQAADLRAIYTEIATDNSSLVPGAKDASGNPAVARFIALFDFTMSHDGSEWMVRGQSNLGTSLDQILILGSGLTGNAFAQDGQPVQGGTPPELYDFFDSGNPASWDENGNIAYGARARGGVTANFEKIFRWDGTNHVLQIQSGTSALGLVDIPANPTGDELFGNSMGSVTLFNDGTVQFGNTPITNCSSFRYPAHFRNNTAFLQSGVTLIDGEVWDNILYDQGGGTPDGNHYYVEGDTENPDTTIDGILVVDGQVVMRENSTLPNSTVVAIDTFACTMVSNGTWFARGDDPADNDWAMSNNVVLAKTGDDITTPPQVPDEDWGNSFSNFTGNRVGDWVLSGNTTNADINLDTAIVLNGETVVAREGDPVDVNGDGLANDNAFLNTVRPTMTLTDDLTLYFMATLRDGAGLTLGDAYVTIDIGEQPICVPDIAPIGAPNGEVNVDDLLAVINAWGACADPNNCPADIAPAGGDDQVNVDDLLAVINGWGPCGK